MITTRLLLRVTTELLPSETVHQPGIELEGNNANFYTTDARCKGGKVYLIGSLQAILFLLLQNYSITMETASLIQAQATFGLLL